MVPSEVRVPASITMADGRDNLSPSHQSCTRPTSMGRIAPVITGNHAVMGVRWQVVNWR